MQKNTKLFSVDWFSHNIPLWSEMLKPLKGNPVQAIEIGVFEGRSTLWLMENIFTHKDAHLVCIDTFEGSHEHKTANMKLDTLEDVFIHNLKEYEDKITRIKGASQVVLRSEAFPPSEYDFIYIDGSHEAPDVLEDAILAHRLLTPGGILLFDDYTWRNPYSDDKLMSPELACDMFMTMYGREYELLYRGHQLGIAKLTK